MYRPHFTPQYAAEIRDIEAGTGSLTTILEDGAYRILRRDPRKGFHIESADLWVIRQAVIRGLVVVQIYYRIVEENQEFELISIRSVNLTMM